MRIGRAVTALGAFAAIVIIPSTAAATAAKPLPAENSASVTLITGDRALVSRDEHGRPSAALMSEDAYSTRQVGKELYLVPDAALPLLRKGVLDERLFNVTGLIDQGYSDEKRSDLPLIVTGAAARSRTIKGAKSVTALRSIGAAAVAGDKSKIKDLFAALTKSADRISLDGQVKGLEPDLDPATGVEQTGAPEAWKAGYDGAGTTVALLDSGADPEHADLKDRIAGGEDFTGEGSWTDRDGHGTHVASTIAGTGAASEELEDGNRMGMAPKADVLVGRVLNRYGSGQESWIIKGMEWAVAQKADVINMSVGNPQALDCIDEVAKAADKLAAASDSLFVVSAGNSAQRETVSSPGCAKGVLTVGALDAKGETAGFSSRGPVKSDHRIKPEIAAPGVNIMGAWLGTPGGNAYQPMSGTSMAAPHVTGAAALLRQAHPDWTPQQVKDALISGVKKGPRDGVYAQGAGELWLPGSMANAVRGPGTVDVADFAWPHGPDQVETKEITYGNPGSEPVTLSLSLTDVTGQDGDPANPRALKLGARRVTVPANGQASVPITARGDIRVPKEAYGEFGGRVIGAASPTGSSWRGRCSSSRAAWTRPRSRWGTASSSASPSPCR